MILASQKIMSDLKHGNEHNVETVDHQESENEGISILKQLSLRLGLNNSKI